MSKSSSANGNGPEYCDIVMKGGITSGVVYPLAVVKLSEKFVFRNIGGTSAGAIAAACTAAAEYRRQCSLGRNDDAGFKVLEELPKRLGERVGNKSRLMSLFQPDERLRAVYRTLTSPIGAKTRWAAAWPLCCAAICNFPVAALFGFLAGVTLILFPAWCVGVSSAGLWWSGPIATAVAVGLSLMLPSVAMSLVCKLLTRIGGNFFGLCSGLEPEVHVARSGQTGERTPALTRWLDELLEETAGRDMSDPPLTFGDLWGDGTNAAPGAVSERSINLEMMTTNLTFGRPYRLPEDMTRFMFEPSDMRKLFPERIVSHLERNSPDYHLVGKPKFMRLPKTRDLPVLFAVRMSLSFPVLLSAVRLYAVDYEATGKRRNTPEPCWFSDGGIACNFPVHFFDAPLPRWPTFAINLRPYREGLSDTGVWMPDDNRSGILEWRTEIDKGNSALGLARFLGAILDTMQSWSDNMQTRLPGFRDRTAHVLLKDTEGGLNLNMSTDLIQELAARGTTVGEMLNERFADPDTKQRLNWENHRWVRFRSSISCLGDWLGAFERAWSAAARHGDTYADLVDPAKGHKLPSYRLNRHQSRQTARLARGCHGLQIQSECAMN